jgi:hypothetical protein
MADSSQIEVLASARNLGRNIYNFGLVEQWLKYLVTTSDLTFIGLVADKKTSKKIEKSQKMMLGQLISDILDTWHPDNQSQSHQTKELFDIRISTSYRIEMSLDDYNSFKQSLEELVKDRNYLVHQFSKEHPLHIAENCHEAALYLDKQREKHLSIMQNLQEIVKTHIGLVKDIKQSFK